MEKTAILSADFLDIIFEGRNKEYGAYDLRRTYNRRMRVSITVMLSVTLMLWLGQLLAGSFSDNGAKLIFNDTAKLTQVDIPDEQPLPPPPEFKPPPPKQIASIDLATPKITPDDQVKETEFPPVEEAEGKKIDLVNNDGKEDDGTIQGPVGDGNRNIIVAPKAIEEDRDKIWTSVEIESTFPGGRPAWERFLNKNLHYPQQAQDNEIQGIVEVKFIVDKEGNVSDVEAVSGPQELRDEAIRAIRKSGKWTPAIQNGNKVKSYKKQPIIFRLESQ